MDQYKELILRYGKLYDINPNWICAIITQESNWDPWAVRYEPTFKYVTHSEHNSITENECQKMSWGLGQIMGSVAREQGLKGYISQLTYPEINIHHMCVLISDLMHTSNKSSDVFAMYNGGKGILRLVRCLGVYANQSYVDSVMEHLKKFSL